MSQAPSINTDKAQLLAAAAIIREHGFGTGGNLQRQGLCLMQAVAITQGHSPADWAYATPPKALVEEVRARMDAKDRFKAARIRAKLTLDPIEVVWLYNDWLCDGADEAISILETAAERS